MGQWLSALLWPAPTDGSSANVAEVAARRKALYELRESDGVLTSKIEHKRRRIADIDADMVEIGLRAQRTNARLCDADTQTLRALYRDRKLMIESRERMFGVRANVRATLMQIEDSGALIASAHALASGAHEQATMAQSIERAMDGVRTNMACALSSQRAADAVSHIDRVLSEIDDTTLAKELCDMMNDEQFIGQFDETDLDRARAAVAVRLPDVPRHEPRTTETCAPTRSRAEVVSELGL